MTFTSKQATKLPLEVKGGEDFLEFTFDLTEYAKSRFGKLEYGNVLAYLLRRFGYPNMNWDGCKDIAQYKLTTPMANLWLSISVGHPTFPTFGYITLKEIDSQAWQENDTPIESGDLRDRIITALKTTIDDLARPVSVRDWFINIAGKVNDLEGEVVERSHHAGYSWQSVSIIEKLGLKKGAKESENV